MHGDVGAIPRELNGDRTAEASRGSRDKGFQAMEIAWLSRRHHPLPSSQTSAYEKGSNTS